jgi:hypothetical protein
MRFTYRSLTLWLRSSKPRQSVQLRRAAAPLASTKTIWPLVWLSKPGASDSSSRAFDSCFSRSQTNDVLSRQRSGRSLLDESRGPIVQRHRNRFRQASVPVQPRPDTGAKHPSRRRKMSAKRNLLESQHNNHPSGLSRVFHKLVGTRDFR